MNKMLIECAGECRPLSISDSAQAKRTKACNYTRARPREAEYQVRAGVPGGGPHQVAARRRGPAALMGRGGHGPDHHAPPKNPTTSRPTALPC